MAVFWSVIGVVVPFAAMTIYLQVTWWINDTPRVDRQFETSRWLARGVMPLIGSTWLLAVAAFATWAPRNYRGFAETLGLLFLVALASGFVASLLQWLPRRARVEAVGVIKPEILVFVFVPTLLAAIVLVVVRVSRDLVKESVDPQEPSADA